jgi:hypothetical protein
LALRFRDYDHLFSHRSYSFSGSNLYSITTNQAAIIALFRVMNRYVGNLPMRLSLAFVTHVRALLGDEL